MNCRQSPFNSDAEQETRTINAYSEQIVSISARSITNEPPPEKVKLLDAQQAKIASAEEDLNQSILVSIILPLYKCEAYLQEAIDSIRSQKYQNFECLMVLDNSPDGTEEIARKACQADARFQLIESKNNGLSGALNQGLSYSKGKYIARTDADDICHPDRIQRQVEYLEANDRIALLGTAFQYLSGNELKHVERLPKNPLLLAWKQQFDSFVGHPTVMFRHSILADGLRYKDQAAEDFELFSKIMRSYWATNLNDPLLIYRLHDTNKSKVESAKMAGVVEQTALLNFDELGIPRSWYSKARAAATSPRISRRDIPAALWMTFRLLRALQKRHLQSLTCVQTAEGYALVFGGILRRGPAAELKRFLESQL